MHEIRIGTAGWSIPSAMRATFSAEGSHLERYASRLNCVEINSSFYRPHKRATYERWAASVPADFRFAVKLPKAITHERRLVDCEAPIAAFAEQAAGLGTKRGPVLVQLPPSLTFDPVVAANFFDTLASITPGAIACEPRHPSWFAPAADALLRKTRVARVFADPAPAGTLAAPGRWDGLTYIRLHGSPHIYRSAYDHAAIEAQAEFARAGGETWVIYDNTANGAAWPNALELMDLLGG